MSTTSLSELNTRFEAGETVELHCHMLPPVAGRDYAFLKPLVPGMQDVLLLQSVLIDSGVLEFPPAGSIVRCGVVRAPRGPRVSLVKSIERTHIKGSTTIAPEVRGPEKMVVKFFNAMKKIGFFTRDDGVDVYVHISVLEQSGVNPGALQQGTYFDVEYRSGPRGFNATRVVA